MKHLFVVTYSGDSQGTALERELKEYVRSTFDGVVCSVDALDAIFEDICKHCATIAKARPRCKVPQIEIVRLPYGKNCYIHIKNEDANANRNTGLLQMRQASTLYITKYETVSSAVENNVTEI